jgi:hypothetical protein
LFSPDEHIRRPEASDSHLYTTATLDRFRIVGRVVRELARDATFVGSQFPAQRILFVRDFAQSRQNIQISIAALMRAFDCAHHRAKDGFKKTE